MLKGVFVPLVTPFLGNMVDEDGFADHIEMLLGAGISGLITGGICGEGPTLSFEESRRLIEIAVFISGGRVPVIAASGTNSTAGTIRATLAAEQAGADAALIVTPYYNKPTQEGVFRHVEAVATACRLPLIVHHAPQRTRVVLAPSTLERLREVKGVIGLLDEDEDPVRRRALLEQCSDRLETLAPGLWAPDHMARRVPKACVSALANVAPRLCVRAWEHGLAGHAENDTQLIAALDRLEQALATEPEPAGIKYAVSLINPSFNPAPRLPLTEPDNHSSAAIRAAVAGLAATFEAAHCQFV
jgi:4-hydroxy-tetrahydrodipicolinate synthase